MKFFATAYFYYWLWSPRGATKSSWHNVNISSFMRQFLCL